MRYGEFLKRAIFTPLDMKDTMFVSALEEKAERLALIYSRNDDGSVTPITDAQVDKLDSEAFCSVRATSFDGGGSGLCSTLADYSKFAMMLLNNGEYNGARILSRKTVEYLHTDQLSDRVRRTIDFEQLKGYSYSNLMRIMRDTGEARSNGSVGEYGWDGMLGTYFFIDPKEELIVIYGQQVLNGDNKNLIRKMRSIVYSAL
jgi:CubicO group peptidase (beta-lactamase class C family)